jgi:hypothetical protein
MKEYSPALLALIAAMVAIVGQTWDPKAKGRRKLTLSGALALIVALSVFFLALQEMRNARTEAARVSQERSQLRSAAYEDLVRASDDLAKGFARIHNAWRPPVSSADGATLGDLTRPAFVAYIATLDLMQTSESCSCLMPDQTWHDALTDDLIHGQEMIAVTLRSSGDTIDPVILQEARRLYNHLLVKNAIDVQKQLRRMPTSERESAIVTILIPEAEYVAFINAVVRFRRLVETNQLATGVNV